MLLWNGSEIAAIREGWNASTEMALFGYHSIALCAQNNDHIYTIKTQLKCIQ